MIGSDDPSITMKRAQAVHAGEGAPLRAAPDAHRWAAFHSSLHMLKQKS